MGRVGAGGFIAEIHIEGICLCRRVGRGLKGYLLAAALTLANFGYIQRIAAAAGGNYGRRFARVLYVYLHVLQVGAVGCILYGELQIEGLARVYLVRAELVAFDYKLRHRGGGILVACGRQALADVYEKAHRAALEVALVIAVGDVEVHLLYAYGSLLAQTQMIQELNHLPPAYGAGVGEGIVHQIYIEGELLYVVAEYRRYLEVIHIAVGAGKGQPHLQLVAVIAGGRKHAHAVAVNAGCADTKLAVLLLGCFGSGRGADDRKINAIGCNQFV